MTTPRLQLSGITKRYPSVVANSDVSLTVMPGETHAVLGENGAGKSTLMKILGGVVAPSGGSIRIDGVAHDRLTVRDSMEAGIAFVHQELNLFDNLTVAANIFIGREPRRFGSRWLIAERRMNAAVQAGLRGRAVDEMEELAAHAPGLDPRSSPRAEDEGKR